MKIFCEAFAAVARRVGTAAFLFQEGLIRID
jgi:hypothetical protein